MVGVDGWNKTQTTLSDRRERQRDREQRAIPVHVLERCESVGVHCAHLSPMYQVCSVGLGKDRQRARGEGGTRNRDLAQDGRVRRRGG